MAAQVPEHDFLVVLHWLEDCTGLKFRDDQFASTVTIIRRIMEQLDISRTDELRAALNNRPGVMDQLINQLTVGETYFFRETAQFDLIRDTIIPELISRRGIRHTIRAWSAGCASGQEAYSLAIVCHQQLLSDQVTILATDISEAALAKARTAFFRPWSFRGNAMAAAEPHLIPKDDGFQLKENIKRRVTFQNLNLAANVYPSAANGTLDVDLILCRNVLIYFGHDTIHEIGERFYDCLAPGGWLLTASGDPSLSGVADFETVASKSGIAYRKSSQLKPWTRYERKESSPNSSATEPPRLGESNRNSTRRPGEGGLPATAVGDSMPALKQVVGQEARGTAKSVHADVNSRTSHGVAWAALGGRDFDRAVRLTEDLDDDPEACLINVKATAAIDQAAALDKCRKAVGRHTLSEELHYLYGVLLVDANRSLEALQSLQKVIFLDRSSIMAHFLFGSVQLQQGQLDSARRHFRNVCELSASQPPERVLPLSGGDKTVADIAIAAESQLVGIDAIEKDT